MPTRRQIISQRNSAAWDQLVRDTISRRGWGGEETAGGLVDEDEARKTWRKLRTAARHEEVGSRVYYKPCPTPGRCPYGRDCEYHLMFSFYPIEDARKVMLKRASTGKFRRQ